MIAIDDLLNDPLPNQTPDTNTWTKLLKLASQIPDKQKALILLRRLWTIRALGTTIRPTTNGPQFKPLIHPDGDWESEKEFREIKVKYLTPFASEITELLRKASYEQT